MSLSDKLNALARRLPETVELLKTEEATKNALIMPFIAALGYDVFDPLEVVPEYTADVGLKKGEKVDYALKRDGDVIILIEAKKASEPLKNTHSSQLYRYFGVSRARIAILTNGIVYRFFSDLEEPNKMDEKAFLEIDLGDLRDNLISELKKLSKENFELDSMLSAASDMKYVREIRARLEMQFIEPEEDFVQFFFRYANPGARFGQSAKEQFTRLVRSTLTQVVADKVSDRLRSALQREDIQSGRTGSESPQASGPPANNVGVTPVDAAETSEETGAVAGKPGIVTTEEELEGYRIVKAVACRVLSTDRISYRDTKSYFAVLCDDNNRKPICRLHFNRTQKYIGLFDAEKNEERHAIAAVEDLYRFAESLEAAANRYASKEE